MTTEVTNYIVRTKYETAGAAAAAKGVDGIAQAAGRASRSGGDLKNTLMSLGGIGLAGGALALGKKVLVDFNSGMEQAKSTTAGLLMMNRGGTFIDNMKLANSLVERLQIRAKSSTATTAALVRMMQGIARPVSAAGANMKDLEDIATGAAVASKAFGVEAGDAAREVEQMLMGGLEKQDRFGRALVEPMGFSTKSFNALSAKDRLKTVLQAFNQPAIKEMAEAQANSFAGVTSTMQDNLEMALGKVGLPLMKALTAEVKQWNKWIDQNPGKIAAIVADVGKGLVDGFNAVKSAVMWISDNKETLMALAKAALVMKGGSIVGDLAGTPFRALAGLSDSMSAAGNSAKGFTSAMGSAASRLGQIGSIVGIVGAGASLGASAILSQRDKEIAQRDNAQADFDYWRRVASGKAKAPSGRAAASRVQDALKSGILARKEGGGFTVNQKNLALGAGRAGDFAKNPLGVLTYKKSTDELKVEVALLRHAMESAWKGQLEVAMMKGWMATATLFAAQIDSVTKSATQRGAAKAPPTNINVEKVVVAAKDPDRWIHDLTKAVRKQTKTPSRPQKGMRGGGV